MWGRITKAAVEGASHFIFSGTIAGHGLGAGTYQLTATPSLGIARLTTFVLR